PAGPFGRDSNTARRPRISFTETRYCRTSTACSRPGPRRRPRSRLLHPVHVLHEHDLGTALVVEQLIDEVARHEDAEAARALPRLGPDFHVTRGRIGR